MTSRPKKPEARPAPRLYLMTPPLTRADEFSVALGLALEAGDIAAVLLRLGQADERELINCIKAIATVVQKAGAALVIAEHADLAARGGADGAHLTGADAFAAAAPSLKPDRIAGAGGLVSRHDAMAVAEKGADYVMFGEPDDGERPSLAAIEERVAWWAEVFEVPCVAYAASLSEIVPLVAAGADFIAVDYIWNDSRGPAAALVSLQADLRLPEAAI
ncbi:MAG: thiamine phosphate synthase [Pseudolabrys sp.]|nr:thiamine phosphate synthase [Pseudolabrys sp.]MBV9954204.1 thiamine phosphate synthase [Pseudolabrys sp.]